MNSLKRVREDLAESAPHNARVIRSHRKPPTGNVRKALTASALVAGILIVIAPVAGTTDTRQPVAAPVVDSEGTEVLDPELTTDRDIISRSAEHTVPATVTVRTGDTYSGWAVSYCGNFGAWPNLQAANGWHAHLIPVGATAKITCSGYTVAVPKPAAVTAPVPVKTWVHPLASGKLSNSCYRTSNRPSHGGIDIAEPSGTAIRSVAAGTIYRKAFESGGAGYYVTVRHAGNVFSQYHHLRSHSFLNEGASVQAGQTIAYVGRTGNATGNHLHLEIRSGGSSSGNRVNPASFMRSRGVNVGC